MYVNIQSQKANKRQGSLVGKHARPRVRAEVALGKR